VHRLQASNDQILFKKDRVIPLRLGGQAVHEQLVMSG